MTDRERDDDDDKPEGPEGDVAMSFFDHLGELRSRLIRMAIGLALGVAIAAFFVRELQDVLLLPLENAWANLELEGRPKLQDISVLDPLLTHIRIAITAGIFLAAPVIFYQGWKFVSPGLYKKEKRYVIPFVTTSVVMFSLGAVFCYLMVLPYATQWFLEYPLDQNEVGGVEIISQYRFPDYVKYTTKLLIGFGLMFQLPLLVFFLAAAGAITHKTLLRHWKISVLLIFVASAFLTPPDPITLTFMAVPMVALFFASVGVAYVFSRRSDGEPALADGETEDGEDGEGGEGEAPEDQ
jgi:sec-independent protein translocase protein TatC